MTSVSSMGFCLGVYIEKVVTDGTPLVYSLLYIEVGNLIYGYDQR